MKILFDKNEMGINVSIQNNDSLVKFSYILLIQAIIENEEIQTVIDGEFEKTEEEAVQKLIQELNDLRVKMNEENEDVLK